MAEAQANLDVDQLLNDTDCDIQDEYNSVVDGVFDMRRKFSLVVMQFENKLRAKQAEMDHFTARHQQGLSYVKTSRNKLRQQSHKLGQYRHENRLLRIQNRELVNNLEVARKELEKVQHLRCDICMDSFKNVMVLCGHSFCRDCLMIWLRQPKDSQSANEPENRCPICRQSVKESDIRAIYVEPESQLLGAFKGDDNATDVISLASDSDYKNIQSGSDPYVELLQESHYTTFKTERKQERGKRKSEKTVRKLELMEMSCTSRQALL